MEEAGLKWTNSRILSASDYKSYKGTSGSSQENGIKRLIYFGTKNFWNPHIILS